MNLTGSVDKLCRLSQTNFSLLPTIQQWPETLAWDSWYFSPHLMSLFGTSEFQGLDERDQFKLSFFETLNFFSLNIHGERFLLAGLCERLYGPTYRPEYQYLHHFLDEENKHLNYFGGFCMRYAEKVYPDRKISLPREYLPGESDLLFFIRIMIFEEIVDYFNVAMAADQNLHPLVRQMNEMHHADEVRHLAFGRLIVRDIWQECAAKWSEQKRAEIRTYAANYLKATWREYYNVDFYADAGFEEPFDIADVAFEASKDTRLKASKKVIDFLLSSELLTSNPLI